MESGEKKSHLAKNERELTNSDKIMIALICGVGLVTCVFIFLKLLVL